MMPVAIVSTRLPSGDGHKPGGGGPIAGLTATAEESGGIWLGWDGKIAAEADPSVRTLRSGAFHLLSVTLSRPEYDGWYFGSAKRALWPLLNGRVHELYLDAAQWAAYRSVNARFAARLAERLNGHELVWVHGHHFLLVAEELRRLGIGLPIGFLFDTPFASAHALAKLPCWRELVEALSAFDLVGFRSENDMHNFRAFVGGLMGATIFEEGTVSLHGRRFRTGAFPLGADPRHFAGLAVSGEAVALSDQLVRCLGDRPGIIGVDPLEWRRERNKRLVAFERALQQAPLWPQRPFLLQLISRPPGSIIDHDGLTHPLAAASRRGRHCNQMLVRYLDQSIGQVSLAALCRSCRVGLILPQKDGLDHLAQEYVAAQCAANPGVLVLSTLTSSAEHMAGAVLADPNDADAVAMALRRALNMSLDERRDRWSDLIMWLKVHDLHHWRRAFLDALRASARGSRVPRDVGARPMRSMRRDERWRDATCHTTGRAPSITLQHPIA